MGLNLTGAWVSRKMHVKFIFARKKGQRDLSRKKKQRKLLFLTEISEGNLIINDLIVNLLISNFSWRFQNISNIFPVT